MTITALPSLDRTDPTFREEVDLFFGTQLPAFSVEAEAARVEINSNTSTASTAAATATTQAGIATTKAGEALTSANAAAVDAASALASKNAAEAALDAFDDKYLGSKASDPTLDNDGNALIEGAQYFNTTIDRQKYYTGSAWNVSFGDSADVTHAPAGTGAVATTVQDKLRESVSVKDFGAVGDGVTNDTVALTNFWNSAIANPGVPHCLDAKIYAVSSVLPEINISNVKIYGEGSDTHDVGTLMTGTVLKWIGASGTATPLVKIASISGASNQRISHVVFSGIGINCNNGALDVGIEILSVGFCEIDVAVSEANVAGTKLGVVASLGELSSLQRCNIKFKGRQLIANGVGMMLDGLSSGNVSMNHFWCDIQHKDVSAIYIINADNNDWDFVRTYKIPAGTAADSISLLGGATELESARVERFHFLSCNLPLHAYGTGTHTYPSKNTRIYCLDTNNGSPEPVIGTGASVHWIKDTSRLFNSVWEAYTPTVSSSTGTITTYSASGRYAIRGNVIVVFIRVIVTTNGTGAGLLNISLPVSVAGGLGATFAGKERVVTGKAVVGYADSTNIPLQFYDGTYPGGNGYVIEITSTYETSS